MKFKYQIPRARYKADGIRALDGSLIPAQKKIKSCPRDTTGTLDRRILKRETHEGYDYSYHATKGWRKSKV